MANEPTDEDRANAKVALISVQSYPSHSQVVRDVVAAALAAERERTVERCANEGRRRADNEENGEVRDALLVFAEAIRALGRGKP